MSVPSSTDGRSKAKLWLRRSQLDSLDFVVDFEVEGVEVTNECLLYEWARWLLIARLLLLQTCVQ